MSDKESNLRIAESITARFAWNNQTFQEGDCVALLDGEVIAVSRTPAAAVAALRAREPDPKRGMVVEVRHPTVDVVR